MIRVVRRVLLAVPLALVATAVVFTAVSLAGDPLASLRQPNVPPEALRLRAHELGLDRPLPVRYWHWITGVLHGDLGRGVAGQDIAAELLQRGLVSLRLVTLALVLAVAVSISAGFWAAVRRGRLADRAVGAMAVLLLTLPTFWTAVVVKQGGIALNQALGVDVVATLGDATPGTEGMSLPVRLADYGAHLLLPTIVLTLSRLPEFTLYQRSATAEVLGSDYLLFARAKGLSRRRVLLGHGLRTSLIPVTTMIAMEIPWILGGLVIIESVFGWHGLGEMLVDGIKQQDTNAVLAFLLVSTVLITVLNLAADLLYGVLDPRTVQD
ncbi:ABC transporter permease [Streptosporangium sp. NPDC051022]|uniref:ABC transporter permease n=1 Tax=Streptosporangium sp. NPDC051022 TaxID=3155752 RepID=UPI00341BAF2A